MNTFVVSRLQFIGYHRFKNAPHEVSFLRDWHRHVFYVQVMAKESESRQIEFILLKRRVGEFVEQEYNENSFEESCEQIAVSILNKFPELCEASVFEDNENGAVVTR